MKQAGISLFSGGGATRAGAETQQMRHCVAWSLNNHAVSV